MSEDKTAQERRWTILFHGRESAVGTIAAGPITEGYVEVVPAPLLDATRKELEEAKERARNLDMTVRSWRDIADGHERVREARQRELEDCREALREIVELKDGPRDEDYERRKPEAWNRARTALQQAERKP